MKHDMVIVSVPYCEPLPLVAPVLLAGCLQSAGISAKGVDLNADFLLAFNEKSYFVPFKNFLTIGHLGRSSLPPETFKSVMSWLRRYLIDLDRRYQPKYLGISIFTSESLDFALLISYVARRYLPHLVLLAGGKGLEVDAPDGRKHYDVWNEHNIVDTIVVGDAESAIIDVIRNDQRGVVFASAQTKQDLDQIPLAQWDDYDLQIYTALSSIADHSSTPTEPYLAITGSKGCVRQCTFCDVASFWPDFIYRDPERVADEMIYNYKKTGIKTFQFTDNLINGSISNFRKMNEVLCSRIPNTIKYRGYAIFRGRNQMPEEDFELAARAGSYKWSVGVESGSERLRNEMKKKFDDQDLDWSISMLAKYGMMQTWLLMVGYPSETEDDHNKTVDLIRRYSHLGRSGMISVQVTPTFMMLNNSPLIRNPDLAEHYGLNHLTNLTGYTNKFWISTKNPANDFPTRSRRWKHLISVIKECGYQLGSGMPIAKWTEEIETLDKIYHDHAPKIIPISRSA